MTSTLPVVFSLAGTTISAEELRFFEDYPPYGYILFKRNIESPAQVKALVTHLKSLRSQEECAILIDQEGGRVQRLGPPHWGKYRSMHACETPAILNDTLTPLSCDLQELGINMNCAPVLDLLYPETDTSIGDRAFSHDAQIVSAYGIQACEILQKHQIAPIIKHLPGHGRAQVDSHKELPVVAATLQNMRESDFIPFQSILKQFPTIGGMVGHCLYTDIDTTYPASLSQTVIHDIIRGEIGLRGTLFSDDLSMGALARYGDIAARAALSLQAGCDIALYCAGDLTEMRAISHSIS